VLRCRCGGKLRQLVDLAGIVLLVGRLEPYGRHLDE
jgi:hypothetical protein